MGTKSLEALRPGFRRLFRKIVLLGHLLADGGELRRYLVLEFLDLGARLCGFARFGRIALFQLGLALQDDFGGGFPFRIDQQILQILIRKCCNPVVCPVNHRSNILF
jgi:hypothetical protein